MINGASFFLAGVLGGVCGAGVSYKLVSKESNAVAAGAGLGLLLACALLVSADAAGAAVDPKLAGVLRAAKQLRQARQNEDDAELAGAKAQLSTALTNLGA